MGTTPTDKHETKTVRNFIMGAGTYHSVGHGLTEIINKHHPWLRCIGIDSFEGPKIVTNLMKPENKKDSITSGSNSYWVSARKAEPPFGPEPYTHYFLARQATAAIGLVTLDSKIRSWVDLKGKTVSLYVEGSIVKELWNITLDFHGLGDKVKKVYLGLDDAREHLLSGKADGVYLAFSVGPPQLRPTSNLVEVMKQRLNDLYFVGFNEDEVRELAKKTIFPIARVPIRAKDLQQKFGVKQNKEDITWLALTHSWICDKELDPEIAYEVVKTLIEYRAEFKAYTDLEQGWTSPQYFPACGVPLEYYHPGARKYYDEHGLKIELPA